MSDHQNNEKRVVVWEGEWTPYRRFARTLLKVRDFASSTTTQAQELRVETSNKTYTTVRTGYKETVHSVNTLYKDYPFAVLSLVSVATMLGTRRYTKNAFSLVRNGVVGFGAGAAILYPQCFVHAVYQPRHFFEQTFLPLIEGKPAASTESKDQQQQQ